LDRALRLGLVPATVERDVQGRHGMLQARPERWVGQADVEAKSMRADGWCALPPQFDLMYAFDALIGNEGRTSDRVLYDASSWMLLLTGHDRAFGASKALPPHPQSAAAESRSRDARRLASWMRHRSRGRWGNLLPIATASRCWHGAMPCLGRLPAKPRVEEDSGPERRERRILKQARGFHPRPRRSRRPRR